MEYILISLIFLGAVFFSLGRRHRVYAPPESTHADPAIFKFYEACESLFVNRSELALFHALSRAAPQGVYVFAKPRLEDIIRVKRELPNAKLRFSLRGRIKSRHVDFLLIDDQGRPRMAIELDGKSHKRQQATAGDALKNGLFDSCEIPLRRIATGESFSDHAAQIMQELQQDYERKF
jgi:very-short-patch-repair endonuclease